ncbi:MAG: ATP-binding cassette domain-containing protein [Kiritimatiellia bacterium]|jgi:ATP-binding cassette subfamily F protein uup
MALISLQDVSLRMGGDPILDHVDLNIERGECACLTGRNGSGKTTLLRLLAGLIEPDGGMALREPGLRVAYLPQQLPADLHGSVREVVEAGMMTHAGTEPWERTAAADSIMSRLGLDPAARLEQLSGGLRRRAMLARTLVGRPDLLLLDEPTNHLDLDSIEWLENFLKSRVETLLFVTHDRAFLRRLARRIIDLDRGRLASWDCDYDTFLQRKQQLLDDEAVAWERLSRKLDQEEAWLRKGVRARRTRNEGRVRALLELRKTFSQRRLEQGVSRMQLQAGERSGALALKVNGLGFAYPGKAPIVQGLDLRILKGERIGIIGPNGSGKTTLLRLLTGRLEPASGSVTHGSRLQIGGIDQLRTELDPEKSVAENLAEGRETVMVNGRPRHIFAYLQDFLFEPARARTPVKVLSGGERHRLLLARLFLDPGNLLALDEPTNDLDIETLELLEEQLATFDGTLLLVSHDRVFLNQVVTSTLVMEGGGRVVQYAGGYDDRLAQRPPPAGDAGDKDKAPEAAPASTPAAATTAPGRATRRRLSYNEQRELAGIGDRIEALETELRELHEQLQDPEAYRQPPETLAHWRQRLAELPPAIEKLVDRWAELETIADG